MTSKYNSIRVAASSYARRFLANKYHDEYEELYRAYLINRGIPVREKSEIIDERTTTNE